jgi:hypothetical protein
MVWCIVLDIKNDLIVSWEITLDKLYLTFFNFVYIYILHKCKESKDANKLLIVDSKDIESDEETMKEKSTMHFFYEDEIELQQNIHHIKDETTYISSLA